MTRRVAHLAVADEARHVAFGVAHLEHRLAAELSALHTRNFMEFRLEDGFASP